MRIYPYNNKDRYLSWKEGLTGFIEGISKENSDILLRHLNSSRDRLISMMKKMSSSYGVDDITTVTDEQLHVFFNDMRNGKITKPNGQKYICVRDFVKMFKAFWHWHQRVNAKKGIQIQDITVDLDTREEKPDWVYLTEEQIRKLADNAKYEWRVLIWFLYDTGIRAPTELMNVKVSDLHNDFKELNIREEIVKIGSFGRRIKLMLYSSLLKEYVKLNNLKSSDSLFNINYNSINKYLKNLAKKLFGEEKTLAGQRYCDLTLYDFRHNSCCYWLPRYKSESALKYRFGWKESDKIHYYSELLGMKDTISEQDMFVDLTRTEIEKRLEKSEKEREILNDKFRLLEEEQNVLKQTVAELIHNFNGKNISTPI